jgi:hypothetical protein
MRVIIPSCDSTFEDILALTNDKESMDIIIKQIVMKRVFCLPKKAKSTPPKVQPANKNVWSTLDIRLLAFTL